MEKKGPGHPPAGKGGKGWGGGGGGRGTMRLHKLAKAEAAPKRDQGKERLRNGEM